jgi:flagellar basal body-associated protein FliL
MLFDEYAVTAKGTANNLEHRAADDTADQTTFRIASLVLDMPAEDPVFIASGSIDPYTIYSKATVEYTVAGGRRVADVTTIRSSPLSRSLAAQQVDVVATSAINVVAKYAEGGSGAGGNNNGNTVTQTINRGGNSSTIIIIGVGVFMGTAFVVAGFAFMVKNKMMKSRVQSTKDRVKFYSPLDVPATGVRHTPVHPSAVAATTAVAAPATSTKRALPVRATSSAATEAHVSTTVAAMVESIDMDAPAGDAETIEDSEASPRRVVKVKRAKALRKTASDGSAPRRVKRVVKKLRTAATTA